MPGKAVHYRPPRKTGEYAKKAAAIAQGRGPVERPLSAVERALKQWHEHPSNPNKRAAINATIAALKREPVPDQSGQTLGKAIRALRAPVLLEPALTAIRRTHSTTCKATLLIALRQIGWGKRKRVKALAIELDGSNSMVVQTAVDSIIGSREQRDAA